MGQALLRDLVQKERYIANRFRQVHQQKMNYSLFHRSSDSKSFDDSFGVGGKEKKKVKY